VLLQPLATLLGAPPPVVRPRVPAPLPAYEFLVAAGSTVGPPPRPPTGTNAPAPASAPAPVAARPPEPPPPPTHPVPPVLPWPRPRLSLGKAIVWAVVLAATGAGLGVLISTLAT
jgi:hypothetical protein